MMPAYMDGSKDVRRSLAAIFDGHKTEQAAEIAADQLPKILAQREGLPYLS